MPPTSQGARLLAAQRSSTGNASLNASASMAPVDFSASGRRSGTIREPSVAEDDGDDFDFKNVDIPPPPLSSKPPLASPRGSGRPPPSPPPSRVTHAGRGPTTAGNGAAASPGRLRLQQQASAFSHSASRSAVHTALQETTKMSSQKDASEQHYFTGLHKSPRPTRRSVIVPDGAAYPTTSLAAPGLTAIGSKRSSASPNQSMPSPLKALDHGGSPRPSHNTTTPWRTTTTTTPQPASSRTPVSERVPFAATYTERSTGGTSVAGAAPSPSSAEKTLTANPSPPMPSRAEAPAASAAPVTPRYHDYSGFTNAGNTCYAASVLTMLLRQKPLVDGLHEFVLAYGNMTRKVIQTDEIPVTPPSPRSPVQSYEQPLDELTEPDFLDFMDDVSPKQFGSDDLDATDRLWSALHTDAPLSHPLKAMRAPDGHGEEDDPINNDQPRSTGNHSTYGRGAERLKGYSPPATTFRTVETEVRIPLCPLHIALDAAAQILATAPSSVRYGMSVDAIAAAMARHAANGVVGEFFDGMQHDAHEFYVALVSCLETEALLAMRRTAKRVQRQRAKLLKRLRDADDDPTDAVADEDFTKQATDASNVWINTLMQGTMLNVVACRCVGCGMQQVSKETFVNVSVTIPAPGTTGVDTESLVHASLAVDQLDGYKCDKCGRTTRQFQGGCFYAAPALLVVQWKRFSVRFQHGRCVVDKNSTPVDVSQHISVVSRTEVNAVEGGTQPETAGGTATYVKRTSYALKAVVLHHGSSLDAGHYLSLFREEQQTTAAASPTHATRGNTASDEGGTQHEAVTAVGTPSDVRWMIANDSRVDAITAHQLRVATENAQLCYLAMYEAIGTVRETDVASEPSPTTPTRRSWAVVLPPLAEAQAEPAKGAAAPPKGKEEGVAASSPMASHRQGRLSQLADSIPVSPPSTKPPRLAARVSSVPTTPRTPAAPDTDPTRHLASPSAFDAQPLPPPLLVAPAMERSQSSQRPPERDAVSVSSEEWQLPESQPSQR